jgi:hypothetical protein
MEIKNSADESLWVVKYFVKVNKSYAMSYAINNKCILIFVKLIMILVYQLKICKIRRKKVI